MILILLLRRPVLMNWVDLSEQANVKGLPRQLCAEQQKGRLIPAFFLPPADQQLGSTEPVLTACTVLTNEVQ